MNEQNGPDRTDGANRAFELDGISFADERSKVAFESAVGGVRNQFGRLPMVVITGPTASGKSRLARHIIERKVSGPVVTTAAPRNADQMCRAIESAVKHRGYLLLEDVCRLSPGVLKPALSCEVWQSRALGRELATEVLMLDFFVVVTGSNLELSPDLLRRSLVIELKGTKS